MTVRLPRLLAVVAILAATLPNLSASDLGFGPWTFGMSQDEVKSKAEFGPYTSPSATTLETTNAKWGDQNVRATLAFGPTGLDSITLHMLAGASFQDAADKLWSINLVLKNFHRLKANKGQYKPKPGEKDGFMKALKEASDKTPAGQPLAGKQRDAPAGLDNLTVLRKTASGTYEVEIVYAPSKS